MRVLRIAGGSTLVAAMALLLIHQGWRSAPAAGRQPEPAAAAEASSEAPVANIRIFIQHTANDESAAQAAELADYLKQSGFSVASVRSVRMQIHRPSVRFFFKNDRPGSERLVEAIRAFFATDPAQAPDHATDLTDDPQKPQAGEVEVWLATS